MHFLDPTRLYPKSRLNRVHGMEKPIRPLRIRFLKAAYINFLLLQLTFLCLFAYVFASLYQQNSHTHNLKVLFVDYDGGAVGQAVRAAYNELKGNSFPTLVERDQNSYAMEDLRGAVCAAKYWAALYTVPGASARLTSALSGLSASTYNRSDVLTYIWNEARYSTAADSAISANMQTLSTVARGIYLTNNTIASLSTTNPAAVAVFANPWMPTSINIQPTTQSSRAIYNTLVIILIIIQEFFYLGTINGLYAAFKIYQQLYPHRIIIYRNFICSTYTFVGSLCTVGMIWAFRAGWHVNGVQFVLSWMVLWLFAYTNFLVFDILTVWLPQQFVPIALITWMITNVSSILLPFELSPGFFHWGYALPAHEVYVTLMDIWSRGCTPQLHISLPVLFSWWVVGLILSALGVYRRCHYAMIQKDNEERAFQEKINTAIAFEKKKKHQEEELAAEKRSTSSPAPRTETDLEEAEQNREFEEVMRKEVTQANEEELRASKSINFGPSFGVPYREDPD